MNFFLTCLLIAFPNQEYFHNQFRTETSYFKIIQKGSLRYESYRNVRVDDSVDNVSDSGK